MPKKVTNEEFVERLYKVNPKIKPLEEYARNDIKIKFECLVDGTIFHSTPNNALSGHGCPLCGKKIGIKKPRTKPVVKYERTLIGNKYPYFVNYLKDKNDAFRYGYTTKTILTWVCPECNYEFEKAMAKFCDGRFVCPRCSTGDSYPNKFMFNILSQTNLDFIKEYSPDWIKPKRYDFYFSINNKEYIVEMDGRFHKEEDVKKTDNLKDKLALAHHINVIRIDCDYGRIKNRLNYIKKSIFNSELSSIIDFHKVNFEKANKFALRSEISNVCELWEKYKDIDKIKDDTKLTLYTIKKYLNFGQENNLCSYIHEDCMKMRKQQRIERGQYARKVVVQCDQTGEIFPNMKLAGEKYNCNVSSFFYNHGKSAGQLPDGTKLTWTKIPKETSR